MMLVLISVDKSKKSPGPKTRAWSLQFGRSVAPSHQSARLRFPLALTARCHVCLSRHHMNHHDLWCHRYHASQPSLLSLLLVCCWPLNKAQQSVAGRHDYHQHSKWSHAACGRTWLTCERMARLCLHCSAYCPMQVGWWCMILTCPHSPARQLGTWSCVLGQLQGLAHSLFCSLYVAWCAALYQRRLPGNQERLPRMAIVGHIGIDRCIIWTEVHRSIQGQITVRVPQSTDRSVWVNW